MNFLRAADKIVVVGYSMPAEDVAIKDLLFNAIRGRKKADSLRMDVVLKHANSPENRRYEHYFVGRKNVDCRLITGGVEAYLRKKDTVLCKL
jgi:hypothetical protein